jgi:protein-tyrosine-phosphatase
MQEVGLNMDGCIRKAIDTTIAEQANVVVSFVPNEELPEPIAQLPNLQYWDVPDPRTQTIEFHRQVRDDIRAKVAELVMDMHAK